MGKYKIVNIHGHLRKNQNLDELVKEWEKEGVIKFCVLSLGKQWGKHGIFTNEDTKEAMEKYPDIIVGMGHIELGPEIDPPGKVEKLKEEGFSGLKFINPSFPYNDERYFPFYEKAEKLKMPIVFHVGVVSPEENDRDYGVNSENMNPFTLDKVARCFPNLKIILAHPGEPYYEEALTLITTFPNIYLCPSGGGGKNFHISKFIKALSLPSIDGENFEKIYFQKFVFGTDNPPVNVWVKQSFKLLDYFNIEEEIRDLYFWKNAFKIFEWEI